MIEQEEIDFVFGLRPVIEAIKAGKNIDKILVLNKIKSDNFNELKELIKENDIFFQYVPQERLNKVTKKNHQGIIAFLSPVEFSDIERIVPQLYEEGKQPFLVLLDKITDVRNFGAIVRTAECVGVHAVVVPEKGAAKIGNDAIKTSTGAIYNIPICKVKSLVKTVEFLKDSGVKVMSCSEKATERYDEISYEGPIALVMGSEETGVTREILNNSNHVISIPIMGKIQSLNVSVAFGVIAYEALKSKMRE
jgi:23S rRNA (guanosine2251-2'-O)-methyltransferase